jgi:nitrogen fixation NifU-like protein
VVLDHSRRPRNQGPLPGATHGARGDNPFCGDRLTLSLIVDGDRIVDARFEGAGCAISVASASMMTVALRGQTRDEAESLCRRFESMLAAPDAAPDAALDAIVDAPLGSFAGVRRYPVRVKCARLPWQTLTAALAGGAGSVSTE